MRVYPIIPDSKLLAVTVGGKFRLLGKGNEKRDIVLLVRGDLRIERGICGQFFGCANCGNYSASGSGFHKPRGRGMRCEVCETEGEVYYFDGAYVGTSAEVCSGANDGNVVITKL